MDHCVVCRYRQIEVATTDASSSGSSINCHESKSFDCHHHHDHNRSELSSSPCIDRFHRKRIIRVFGSIRDCVLIVSFTFVFLSATMVSESEACFPGGRLIRRLPKSEPPLIYKQHVPNVPENSLAASGPREGRIRRLSNRFRELVGNYNPDIMFKDEEGNGEDRIMSARCKEKLDALAMLVTNFWPGVKLRVTEAWDQDGHHAPDSLHYEGRAVDITTSDRDRNKYGLLARLAAQAGFDWVYYENRIHVHASVKSDSVTRHKRMLKCFPGHASVMTEAGVRKAISDLVTGDRVAVIGRSTGGGDRPIPVYEPIIAFLHRNTSMADAEFVEIRTSSSGKVFTASTEHLVYVRVGGGASSNSSDPTTMTTITKPMGRIEAGDVVLVSSNSTGYSIHSERVVSVRRTVVIHSGIYAPLTPSGTIIVDDVVASCYAAVESEPLAHYSLSPLRIWYHVFGQSVSGEGEKEGVHWFAQLLLYLAETMERFGVANIISDA